MASPMDSQNWLHYMEMEFKMKKIERTLTVISLAVVLGCSYYSFTSLNQLMFYLNEIERVARMGKAPTYHIVTN